MFNTTSIVGARLCATEAGSVRSWAHTVLGTVYLIPGSDREIAEGPALMNFNGRLGSLAEKQAGTAARGCIRPLSTKVTRPFDFLAPLLKWTCRD